MTHPAGITAVAEPAAPARTTAQSLPEGAATSHGRLEFLDALRGIAALTVAVQHIAETQWVGVLSFTHHWFRFGEFGVLVFFICSGFIIPASLERRNNLAEFAIGRVWRLLPLYLAVLAMILALWQVTTRLTPPQGYMPVWDTALNMTMLQVFSSRTIVIGASWTLGYELVFYLLVSLLFLYGAHRESVRIAVGLQLGALLAGTMVPALLLQARPKGWWTFPLVLLIVSSVAAMRIPDPRRRALAIGLSAVIVLCIANRPHDMYFSLLLLGAMFTGSVLFRFTVGQVPGRTAAGVMALAVAMNILTFKAWHIGYVEPISGQAPRWWTEAGTFAAAYVLFGAALLLRGRHWPWLLTYLGTISYSVYLLHALVLLAFPPTDWGHWPNLLAMLALTIGGSVLTYHFIEKPAIGLGRRIVAARRGAVSDRSAKAAA